jgi:hypothetical protein
LLPDPDDIPARKRHDHIVRVGLDAEEMSILRAAAAHRDVSIAQQARDWLRAGRRSTTRSISKSSAEVAA